MRCLSCNKNLSDREANRKYANHIEIKNPEEKYIGLCDHCLVDTDISIEDRLDLDDTDFDEELNDDY